MRSEVTDGPGDSISVFTQKPEMRLQLPVSEALDGEGFVGVDENVGLMANLELHVAVSNPREGEHGGAGFLDKVRPVLSIDGGELVRTPGLMCRTFLPGSEVFIGIEVGQLVSTFSEECFLRFPVLCIGQTPQPDSHRIGAIGDG